MEQENSNTNQPQGSNNAGFDIKSLPKSSIVIAIISAIGAIGVFLPWFSVSMGLFGSITVSGISRTWGLLTFLAFAGAIATSLFSKQMKLNEAISKNFPLYTGGGALLFSAISFIRILTSGYAGAAGFGLYISLLAGIALVLIGFNIIKIK